MPKSRGGKSNDLRIIQFHEQIPRLIDYANEQVAHEVARRHAFRDATAATIEAEVERLRSAIDGSGDAAASSTRLRVRESTEAGSSSEAVDPPRRQLPPWQPPPGRAMNDDADDANAEVRQHVDELVAACEEGHYEIIGREHLYNIRDGFVDADLDVLGFNVSDHGAMLNEPGTGICESMTAYAIMKAAQGGLNTTIARLVIIDIHPKRAVWNACKLKLLDKVLIAKVSVRAPVTRSLL